MKRLTLTIFLTSLWAVGLTGCDSNMTDRDGNSYKTVQIGSQIWMAENLKVRTEGSWCYEDKESNCQKYGRLYNWDAAKVACPAGWHLPSREEFEILLKAVGGTLVESEDEAIAWWSDTGKKLKSTSGWKEKEGENGNGDDVFGFSALAAGGRRYDSDYMQEGSQALFWSSTGRGDGSVYYMGLFNFGDVAGLYGGDYGSGFSVRCLKD